MDFRISNFLLLLLLAAALALPAGPEQSGSSSESSEQTNSRNIRESYGENPFLQDSFKPTTSASVISYQGNPFLSPTKQPRFGNDSTPTNIESQASQQNQVVHIAIYANNPFLHSRTNVANNSTHTKHLTSSDITDKNIPNIINQPLVSDHELLQDESTRTKSDIKCEEYSRQITHTAEILPLVGTSSGITQSTIEDCWPVNQLVIGGTDAGLNEYPHMVALGRRSQTGEFTLLCGGTLISPDWILTAAHCTYGPNGSPNTIRMGLVDLNNSQAGVTVGISKILRHPNYKPPAMYADIALMKLQNSVNFSYSIRPACLYQIYDMVPFQTWVTGWGVTEFGGDQSDRLQKARLEIVDNIACAIRHNQSVAVPYGITPSMICAGDPHGGWVKDTCQGDSGGPMQTRHPKYPCLYQVIGITSFGQACAIADTPGVYTRVSHYLSWVEDNVWPDT